MGNWNSNYCMVQTPNIGDDSTVRYVLAKINHTNGKTLIAFGINPSKANKLMDDDTALNLDTLSTSNGYDNWIMLNVFPLRDADPSHLEAFVKDEKNEGLLKENQTKIESVLKEYSHSDILLGWGVTGVSSKSWFKDEKNKIKKLIDTNNHKVLVVDNIDKLNKCAKPYHFGPQWLVYLRYTWKPGYAINEIKLTKAEIDNT